MTGIKVVKWRSRWKIFSLYWLYEIESSLLQLENQPLITKEIQKQEQPSIPVAVVEQTEPVVVVAAEKETVIVQEPEENKEPSKAIQKNKGRCFSCRTKVNDYFIRNVSLYMHGLFNHFFYKIDSSR